MTQPTTAEPDRFDPIHSSRQMVELIGSVTHQPPEQILRRLQEEFDDPGVNVAADFAARGVEPYVMSDDMLRFYGESDAFLFELAVWNRNANKRFMCKRIIETIRAHHGRPVDVLSIGDGLGFDCLEFARAGHRTTYFELPGKSEAVARKVFAAAGQDVRVLTRPDDLQPQSCDALICLDTLEHVPDPVDMMKKIAGYLRPGGLLFVNAPFYMIHRRYPTHLKACRKFSGSLKLYTDHGLVPIDGDFFWNPLVLAKPDGGGKAPAVSLRRRFVLRAGAISMSLGRWGLMPLWIGHYVRRRGNRWFDKTRPTAAVIPSDG